MRHGPETSVARVVQAMRDTPGEPLTIDEMARIAMFSKFHFSRIFQDVTGMSPGRFLTAVRLAEAKRLLLATKMSIAAVSMEVGYSSVGTFSTRFKHSVGLAPSTYRANGGYRPSHAHVPQARTHRPPSLVEGAVSDPDGVRQGPVYLGFFPDLIPQGTPRGCAVLTTPGRFTIDAPPPGTWHLLAYSTSSGDGDDTTGSQVPRNLLIAGSGPVTVRPGRPLEPVELRLRHVHTLDPPVLAAPLDISAVDVDSLAGDVTA